MGVNTLAVAAEFARVLAAEAAGRAPNASLGRHAPSAARDKAILIDYFGLFMVCAVGVFVAAVKTPASTIMVLYWTWGA